ncbi:MAG: hypothetical protein WDA14_04225, partial [Sphaerochaetaceae bacterium]
WSPFFCRLSEHPILNYPDVFFFNIHLSRLCHNEPTCDSMSESHQFPSDSVCLRKAINAILPQIPKSFSGGAGCAKR